MGRNSSPMHLQSCLHSLKIDKSETDMQDLSQTETQPAMVCFQKDLPMDGIEHSSIGHLLKDSVTGENVRVGGSSKVFRDIPDVFCHRNSPFDVSVPYSEEQRMTVSSYGVGRRCIGEDVSKSTVQNSLTSIPSVPDIVIEHVSSCSGIGSRCQAPLSSSLQHADVPFNLSQVPKKSRTHSDSAIYESGSSKQRPCLRNSLSSSQSLCPPPSDFLTCKAATSKDATACHSDNPDTNKKRADQEQEQRISVESESASQDQLMLSPFLWNLGGFDNFTFAQEKSPKMYWLRRHSDSNVAKGHMEHVNMDCCVARSQSASDSIPEHQQDADAEVTQVMEQVDSNKSLPSGKIPTDSGLQDVVKCQKVKKYLQKRYQNQSLDADDVFMDCTTETAISSHVKMPDDFVTSETSKSEIKSPRVNSPRTASSGAGVLLSEGPGPTVTTPNYSSSSPCVGDVKEISNVSQVVGDKRFQNLPESTTNKVPFEDPGCSPDFQLSNARQPVFDFSFPSPYSVLRDIPVCSGNFVFGILPQGCLSAPFPITLESFALKSPSSPGVLVPSLSGKQDYLVSSPGFIVDSTRWQSGVLDAIGGRKRTVQKEDCAPGGQAKKDDLKQPVGTSQFDVQHSVCLNAGPVRSAGSADKKHSGKDAEIHAVDSSSTSNAATSPKASLNALNSPVPSSPVIGTTTKSSPQVVFDYQFSERIYEQRQTGDNSNFVCPVCGSMFLSYNSLANHVVSHLPSEVITQEGSESSKVHLCKVCSRSFSRSDMLSRHMRLHTGLRPYECHLCQQVFSRSDHLHTHLRTHTGEKPYRCSHCMYAAPRRDMVTRHMRIHVRGGARRGRRSASTSSLASDAGQISDDTASEQSTSQNARPKLEHRKAGSFRKERNWSVTSCDNNDGPETFDDKEVLKMTRTESTTSIDSGVSYLTPRSLAPSLWSPGIDSPDVFTRFPGHFLWPSTSSEFKHDLDKGTPTYAKQDMDYEMHTSFQKCKVTSPSAQASTVDTDELEDHQKHEEEHI